MLALALTLALTAPPDLPTQHFDRIDINHVIGDDGKPRFSQLIFWRWLRDEKRFVSFGFVFLKGNQERPRVCGDKMVVTVHKDSKRWRVTCGCVLETWTVNDPESDDRYKWPDFRREW